MKKITAKEVREDEKYDFYLTVGDLKKAFEEYDIPDDTKIMIERVEDVYFEKRNWGVYLKEYYYSSKDENGNYVEETMGQYHPAFRYSGFREGLIFIDLHY